MIPSEAPGAKPAAQPGSQSLPRALWIGTGIFVLLAAGLLALSIRVGRRAIEETSELEKAPVESKRFSSEVARQGP